MKNFLKTKGYYIILTVCVLATCAGGVVALKRSSNEESEVPSYSTATVDGGQTPFTHNVQKTRTWGLSPVWQKQSKTVDKSRKIVYH